MAPLIEREAMLAQDQEVRDLIRTALDATMLVEAGAGTGKTSALVDRYISLILRGTPAERIVAITFTEKAAAELKDRVRGELERRATSQETPEQERVHARLAIECLDRAPISTIHAFGRSLMAQFTADIGLDPDFSVSDEMQEQRRFEAAWAEELRRLAGEADAKSAIERVLALGMRVRDLRSLVDAISGQREVAAMLTRLPPPPPVTWPSLRSLRDELAPALRAGVPETDGLRARAQQFAALVDRLERGGEQREYVLASAASVVMKPPSYGRSGVVRNWGSRELLDAGRAAIRTVHLRLQELLEAARRQAMQELLPHLARFIEADAARRRTEGTLCFDDLIHGPARLLSLSGEARRAMRDRYDAMLIDEFQDTDPLQVEIALAFATDPDTGDIEPGRLFMVGDPKQSIYRFRRADMAVYANTRRRIAGAGGLTPQLQLNRRSRGDVIDWVNETFARLIGEMEAIQPRYIPVHAYREAAIAGPGVAYIGGEISGNAAAMRQREATQIAAWCTGALAEGWEVEDRSTGEVRKAALRDIAVLIPTRAGLSALERAMQRRGIPYRVEGGSLIYRTQEVRDLINCLTAIDDPSDEVAIVAALRSPAFACSDVELAHWRAADRYFGYLSVPDNAEGRIADALRTLRRWHSARHSMPLAVLVERFVSESGLDESGMLATGTRDPFRRMRFVVEQARAFESNGPESLRSFAQWMEQCAGTRILDHEGAGLDDDEDAVRIFTIHGAKGLEFPIVLLAGLASTDNYRTPTLMLDRQRGDIAIRIGAKESANLFTYGDLDRLNELEQQHAEAEHARLLYVGATRARDHLVLSLYHTAWHRRGGSAAIAIMKAGGLERAVALPERDDRNDVPTPFAEMVIDASADPEALVAERAGLVANAAAQRYTSATAIASSLAGEQKDERQDETEPWARGRGGTRLGRAVHAAIQSLPWDADAAMIRAHARAQAVAEAIPERAGDVAELTARALRSDAATRARTARRALREVPFGVPLGSVIVEGFIDLLIEDEDGIEIVDWKTDRVSAGEVPERLQAYETQAGLYTLGVELATGRPVRRLTYVFVSAGIEASPGDPALLRDRARAQIQAVAT